MRFEPQIHREDSGAKRPAAPNTEDDLPPELLALAEELADSAHMISRAPSACTSTQDVGQETLALTVATLEPEAELAGSGTGDVTGACAVRPARGRAVTAAVGAAVAVALLIALGVGLAAQVTGKKQVVVDEQPDRQQTVRQIDKQTTGAKSPRKAATSQSTIAKSDGQGSQAAPSHKPTPPSAPAAGSFIEVQPGNVPEAPPVRVQELQGAELDGAIDLIDEDVLLPI